MTPTLGRIVLYTLTDADADVITQSRAGALIGNPARAGEQYPAMVVRTFGGDAVNLQVHLDGGDLYWATSRQEGDQPGTWCWPPRI